MTCWEFMQKFKDTPNAPVRITVNKKALFLRKYDEELRSGPSSTLPREQIKTVNDIFNYIMRHNANTQDYILGYETEMLYCTLNIACYDSVGVML